MLDAAMSVPPPTAGEPLAAPKPSPPAATGIRIVMPLVLLGFATVFCSLFFLLWPSGNPDHTAETALHAVRIVEQMQNQGMAGLIRAITDVSIYVIILAGVACF